MNNTLINGSVPNPYDDNTAVNLSGNKSNSTNKHIPFSSEIHFPLVFIGVLACLIFTANSLVIVLVYRNKQLRRTTNLYLACLAFSDLLSGLIAIPLIFSYDGNAAIHVPPIVNTILLFMRFGSSLVNPLLYTWFKEDLKTVLKS